MSRALLALLIWSVTAGAATIRNDDSCDISVLPAATLLLPYFEVDLDDANGETTLFTVTNVTSLDQIAHVTLWTDYGYPVINFNIYLTGYDVQAINLFDILARGVIAPDAGTGTAVTKRGPYSDPNPSLDLAACSRLPGALPNVYIERMQDAFLRGVVPSLGTLGSCSNIGGVHERAIGYATIDVVRSCTTNIATDPAYWIDDIRYDNVLIGDYQQINGHENFAQGGAMVHVRAVPEGGTPQARVGNAAYDAGFERTFYSRYQAATSRTLDGRQPLPSVFATRWINGGPSGFETSMKVWREGRTDTTGTCEPYGLEAHRTATEIVVFDENENATGIASGAGPVGLPVRPELPSTSRTSVSDSDIYPRIVNGSPAGWMYLNLHHTPGSIVASQNWVISSMRAQGRMSTDIDAVALGNGCSAPTVTSEVAAGNGPSIQPAPNAAHSTTGVATKNNDDSCDIALLPAATLLLPYFEVDLDDPLGETTLFTVTNVSPSDHIARVTLWTDYAYPVITFNVYLTGYDVQAINLYDIIRNGIIASAQGTGTRVTSRGDYSTRNAAIDLSACHNLPGTLDPVQIVHMQLAFTHGIVPASGSTSACNVVGEVHDNAAGYATIDVVRACSNNIPTDAKYWTEDLQYDNVLIGDYQQVNSREAAAQGSTMVHIRAIPDGGTSLTPSPLLRTFYSRYQAGGVRDRRQPLPATFAARWIQGGSSSFQTSYKIWREGKTDLGGTTCANWPRNHTSVTEVVRFDEAENAVGEVPRACSFVCLEPYNSLPATSLRRVNDYRVFPGLPNGATSGWMYINLDNDDDDVSSSNWVIVSMRAQGRFSVDMDASALGNGCSPEIRESEVTVGNVVVGPAPNTP